MLTTCVAVATLLARAASPASSEAPARGVESDTERAGTFPPLSAWATAASAAWSGEAGAPVVDPRSWRQLAFELRRAKGNATWPDDRALRRAGGAGDGVIRLGLIHATLDRVDFPGGRVFAMAPLSERTLRGSRVVFALDPQDVLHDAPEAIRRLEIDFDDGAGPRRLGLGERIPIAYAAPGPKRLRLVAELDDGRRLHAAARFEVAGLTVPDPDDTLEVTASIPHLGAAGSGRGYVYLGAGHTAIVNPVVVVEGFDLDDTLDWDELYEMLDQESLIETLRSRGFDTVVLDFTAATDYIQRNAFVLVELIQQVRAITGPGASMVVAGASMGGLVGRHALAYMEQNGLTHGVRNFVSFDAPQRGANIPLGVQQWVDFFASQSAEAAFLRDRLNTPGARQMLVYHFATPPSSTGQPDPLRAALLADLAALGDYPVIPRKVAFANGSGTAANQGYAPGDQLVSWNHDTALLDLIGNVWAVPDGGTGQILQGRIFIFLLANQTRNVTVSGTEPYDNAPGGFRTTMADMDSVPAPAGDIVALHPAHCFIPTVSALDLATPDLFLDVSSIPDPLAMSPFDAIYYPSLNQEHVHIDAQTAARLLEEVERDLVSVADPETPAAGLRFRSVPNPFTRAARLGFVLPVPGAVDLRVYSVDGREVARLAQGPRPAGEQWVAWDGRGSDGRAVAPGLYWARLIHGHDRATLRLVRLE
jgi:hypothetical protein